MNFTKKILALVICLVMCFSFAACEYKEYDPSNDSSSTSSSQKSDNTDNSDVPATDTITEDAEVDTTETPDSTEVEGTNAPVILPEINSVPASTAASASYFDDVAFVGDSVSLKLSYYASSTGKLGNAKFFTAGSLSSANALWEISDQSVHPYYLGVKTLVEDCVKQSGVKKVYIMLGMNDIGLNGVDESIKNFETLVGRILAKSPSVQIVVQSMTPMTSTSTIYGESLNNTSIKEYNVKLSQLCEKNGWSFVDVASVMYDAQGNNLNRSFCSDPDGLGVHFTEAGCETWINYLYTHTP